MKVERLKLIGVAFMMLLMAGMGIVGALRASDIFSNIIGIVAIIALIVWMRIEINDYRILKLNNSVQTNEMIEWMQTNEFKVELLKSLIDEAISRNDFASCTVYIERLAEIEKMNNPQAEQAPQLNVTL
jgi:hypothetical protein